jgi:hypothetical protein
MDQGHHKRLQDRTHTNFAGHTSVARLHDPVYLFAMQNVLPHVGACKHKIKSRVVETYLFAGPFKY